MELPQFKHRVLAKIQPELETLLAQNLKQLEADALNDPIQLSEILENRLTHFWSPIQHLHAVCSTPELRKIYLACLPLLSDYGTALSHNEKLYQAYLKAPQNRITELAIRDFKLSGIALSPEKKQRYADIDKALSELSTKYGENILEATQEWKYQATPEELAGIPDNILPEDHMLTLDAPCYMAVQKYAVSRELREKCYKAYVTRASELDGGKHDNAPLMEKIMTLRQEQAALLGFKNYAEYSLATKMAKKPQEVLDFLNNLITSAKPVAMRELKRLEEFAGHALQPWDMAFYSEKLQKQFYEIDEEQLRPYFPVDHVISELFNLMEAVFGLEIKKLEGIETWHPDVKVFEIKSPKAVFYMDLYVRKNKREGAWMDDYCSRYKKPDGTLQIPVAFLTCNFRAPTKDQPALLTHDEVITLFHEFGHGLHHMLTQIDRIDISGMNNVPWDAVELPSQFMENFCWNKDVLKKLSKHYKTAESLPDDLIQKMIAAKQFNSGLYLMRQLEFGLFDFELHLTSKPVMDILNTVRQKTAVIKSPDYNRSPNTFSHIFDGGYDAGYYSYLWAEVLSCDAFALFEETGIFNQKTGQDYINKLLSQGGSEDIGILFKNFRGREPNNKAFLKSWGLLA
ncbi:MAG TPA: M3 family metallopeptidase [Gammaproteobacteria bacterium]|nr:M3 family metallopeptidase [Gammaproteobacteria bacterium]